MTMPFVLPYQGYVPTLAGTAHAGPRAAVLGRATLGAEATLGASSVIRADGHSVTAGRRLHLGPRATIHIAHDVYPTVVGDDVTVGANAIVHACTLGSRCHVGAGAMILDGSVGGDDVAIEPGAVVTPRTTLESGWLYAGVPARPVRRLEPGELDGLHAQTRAAAEETPAVGETRPSTAEVFHAATALFSGDVAADRGAGVWFGCVLDGGSHGIHVGQSANVQDNTVVVSQKQRVTIGARTTIGHNVSLTDCTIAEDSLVGMGAVVAPGTRIETDVLLAAGAATEPGQVLEAHSFYAGRPARRIAEIDQAKRGIIRTTWPVYEDYARRFAAAQAG